MAELSDVLMMKALEDDNNHDTWGSAGFLWVILIFLFFLAFNGGGLFGNRGFGNGAAVVANDLSQVERDVLTGLQSAGFPDAVLLLRHQDNHHRAESADSRLDPVPVSG